MKTAVDTPDNGTSSGKVIEKIELAKRKSFLAVA